MFQLHLCLSFLNSPRPILPIAKSHRRELNRPLVISGDYMKRTVPPICTTGYLTICREHWKSRIRKVPQAGSWPYPSQNMDLLYIHKCAFRDAICLRYGWRTPLLPANCVCGVHLTIEHALSCPCGAMASHQLGTMSFVT